MTHEHKDKDSDHDLLIRIDERLEAFVDDMNDTKKNLDEHSKRISKLENWRSYTAGAVGLIVLFLTSVMVS